MHVDAEQLQRLVDGELAEPVDQWAREHAVVCDSCRERVARAKSEQNGLFALLGNLDHPRPWVNHTEVMTRGRGRGSGWIGKAAGFVVAAALAGAAYAAPGSPLPSLVAKVFGRGANAPAGQVAQRPAREIPLVSGLSIATGNRMVIVFTAVQATGTIRVSINDDPELEVRAAGAGASFTAGEEALTIDNTNSRADFAIAIPRQARFVEIRIAGNRVFLKDGARVESGSIPSVEGYVIPLDAKH